MPAPASARINSGRGWGGQCHLSDADRRAYERYSEVLHHQASLVESNYTLGQIEGREVGLQEGREEGREEERLAIARRLLQSGVDHQTIASAAELTLAEIATLARELS